MVNASIAPSRPHVRIAILMPIYRDVAAVTLESMVALSSALSSVGIEWVLLTTVGDSSLPLARSELVARAREHPIVPTHLLFVDADGGFPPCIVFDLLHAKADVVGAPFARRGGPGANVVAALPAEPEIVNGAVEVEAVGAGLMMITRETSEALIGMHATRLMMRRRDGGTAWLLFPTAPPADAAAAFIGEDYGFCALVRASGRKVWALWDAETTHVDSVPRLFRLSEDHRIRRTVGSDIDVFRRLGAAPRACV